MYNDIGSMCMENIWKEKVQNINSEISPTVSSVQTLEVLYPILIFCLTLSRNNIF